MQKILSTLLVMAVIASALIGCGKKGPPELTMDQVPEALKAAFTTAKNSLLKKNAETIAELVASKQYAAASLQLQAIASNTDLTDEQRNVVAGATIVVNGALQELAASAQPAADEASAPSAAPPVPAASKEEAAAAAAVLEHYSRTK